MINWENSEEQDQHQKSLLRQHLLSERLSFDQYVNDDADDNNFAWFSSFSLPPRQGVSNVMQLICRVVSELTI